MEEQAEERGGDPFAGESGHRHEGVEGLDDGKTDIGDGMSEEGEEGSCKCGERETGKTSTWGIRDD